MSLHAQKKPHTHSHIRRRRRRRGEKKWLPLPLRQERESPSYLMAPLFLQFHKHAGDEKKKGGMKLSSRLHGKQRVFKSEKKPHTQQPWSFGKLVADFAELMIRMDH